LLVRTLASRAWRSLAAGAGAVVVRVVGGEVVLVVVVDVLVEVEDDGDGAVVTVVGTSVVVGVRITTVGGGRVGTVVRRPRLVVVVGRVVVVEEAVVELVGPFGELTCGPLPSLEETAYQVPRPTRSSAPAAMAIATRRSIRYSPQPVAPRSYDGERAGAIRRRETRRRPDAPRRRR
jgi:hypothetical protein